MFFLHELGHALGLETHRCIFEKYKKIVQLKHINIQLWAWDLLILKMQILAVFIL